MLEFKKKISAHNTIHQISNKKIECLNPGWFLQNTLYIMNRSLSNYSPVGSPVNSNKSNCSAIQVTIRDGGIDID